MTNLTLIGVAVAIWLMLATFDLGKIANELRRSNELKERELELLEKQEGP